MAIVDMPLERLREYRPAPTSEPDFEAFWDETLAAARAAPLNLDIRPVPDYPVEGLRVASVRYDGFAGSRIAGWLLIPERAGPLPALAVYHGYSGSKGYVHDHLMWALQGYVVLAVDTRGQNGDSTDARPYPGGHATGWMTLGILDPRTCYYQGAYADCVRALDVLAELPEVDQRRIGVTGGSQGGGLSLAVAALDARPKLVMADVPFLCHYRRAVDIASAGPYPELAVYSRAHPAWVERMFRTLSYVDVMNLAHRITCPALVTVGLQDIVCPPSTIFATFHQIASAQKELVVFPFNGHEGNPANTDTKLRWAKRILRERPS